MPGQSRHFLTRNEQETTQLATWLGRFLAPGDTVLLSGPIGSGKTHFARGLIQSLLIVPEDVPSPTFTLVQTYETRLGEIWHADLYRLTGIDDLIELGLVDAFDTGISLVEWPDKLGSLRPASALDIVLSPDADAPDTRHIQLRFQDPKWTKVTKTDAHA